MPISGEAKLYGFCTQLWNQISQEAKEEIAARQSKPSPQCQMDMLPPSCTDQLDTFSTLATEKRV